jgi:hypothetical protein
MRFSSIMVKMACERLDCAFISVDAVVRQSVPRSSSIIISSSVSTASSRAPTTVISASWFSLMVTLPFRGSSRSLISSP